MSLRIVAAGGTDDVHKGLVDLVHQRIGFLLACRTAPAVPQRIPAEFLILGLEDQIVPVIRKSIAELRPDALVLGHAVFLVRGEICQPSAIIVQIDNDVQVAVQRPVHDLLHCAEVGAADGVVVPHQV